MSVKKLLRLVSVWLAVRSWLSFTATGTVVRAAPGTHSGPRASTLATSPLIGVADSAADQPTIMDHTCTDLSRILAYWLEEAKKLTFH